MESTSEEAFIAGDVREETKNSFATAINYIVKTVQAAAGTFSATKADGSALEKHHDLETAHENDKVYIKAGEGYRVTEAYNGDTKLESDEGGFFYKVARGGGIMLKAVLELLPAVQPEEKKEDKKEETKSEVKKEEPKAEPKQEATQTVADTTSNTAAAAMRPAVYNLLKIKDKSGRADIAFRNIGTYEIKSPDGIDEGTFVTMNGRIVLTSRSGEMATVENGRLKYVVGDKTYEFEFSQAELDKLAGVKK